MRGRVQERCTRSRFLVALRLLTFSELLGNDIVAQRDTLVTDVHAGTRDKLSDIVLMLVAEGASERARDRKSTRLNSSHLVISYAVFCLKKKNLTQGDA